MTTGRQDRDFLEAIISNSLLEDATEWIQKNMEPEDIFNEQQLSTWAEDKGYTKE